MLPSGDPERFLRVAMSLESEDGSELASTQWRIGQTWVWAPVAEKRADNRIAPGEVRILDWEPRTVPGSVFLRVKVEHVRLSRENLEYHIRLIEKGASGPTVSQLRNYPLGRTMFERRWSVGSLVQ